MPTTIRTDLILPSILAEDVMKGFSGRLTMAASGAILMSAGLQAGADQVGNTVTVPYFEDGGEAQVLTESQAGSLEKITQSSETATVVRLFKGFSVSALARMAKASGRDIYDVAREKIQESFARAVDTLAIQRATARATSASMVNDDSGAAITAAGIVDTLKLFGEDLDDGDLAQWAMNPTPYWAAATLADSTGRTLFTDVQGGRLTQLGGAPVKMTAKTDLVSGSVYSSLLCKKNSIVMYMNEAIRIDEERDATADVDLIIANMYCVVHAYSIMPGTTHAGVAVLKTL